jgi:PAS domain S-box-containing protein
MSEVKKKSLLLVEDEALIALNNKRALERYGYEVMLASCGEKALEFLESGRDFDLVLMDIDLGKGMDGTETAGLILQYRDLPIVFLSSHTEPEVVEKTEKISSYGYVVKNSSITVLDASIKMAFKLFKANKNLAESRDGLKARLVALTQPLESGAVAFTDLFDLEEIQQIQDKFASATGVASIITYPDGSPITRPSNFTRLCFGIIRNTERGCANCFRSDAVIGRLHPDGPIVQTCLSGGLWDAGASIVVGGQHVANWLIGQIRDDTQTEAAIRAYARGIGADEDAAAQAFHEVPAMSRDRFEQIAYLLYALANQLSLTAYHNVLQARMIIRHEMTEQLLVEQKALLEGIMASSPLSIFVKDCQGFYKMINKAGAEAMGYSIEEILGRSDNELLPESTAAAFKQTDAEVMRCGRTLIRMESGIIRGQEHRFKATKSPLLGASGELLGILGFSEEITNQHHHEYNTSASGSPWGPEDIAVPEADQPCYHVPPVRGS